METTKRLTDAQKKAFELIQKLADEGKISLCDAVQLIIAIYENEKEIVYIPYQNPYPYPDPQPWITQPWTTNPYDQKPFTRTDDVPWWERNKIMCDNGNNANTDPSKKIDVSYATGVNWKPNDWVTNILIG